MIDSSQPARPKAVNVAAQRVAAVYAKAFLDAAQHAGQAEALVAELDSVCQALAANPRFEAVLGSALIPHEEKVQMLDRVFQARLSPLTLNLLKVLSSKGRLDITRAVGQAALELFDELRGRVRVEMRTATPIDEALARSVEAALKNILSGEPRLQGAVEPELIGGIVLRVGDTVYDGSVARQLRQVREQMKSRSIHEIQSGRDRLGHSGGN